MMARIVLIAFVAVLLVSLAGCAGPYPRGYDPHDIFDDDDIENGTGYGELDRPQRLL